MSTHDYLTLLRLPYSSAMRLCRLPRLSKTLRVQEWNDDRYTGNFQIVGEPLLLGFNHGAPAPFARIAGLHRSTSPCTAPTPAISFSLSISVCPSKFLSRLAIVCTAQGRESRHREHSGIIGRSRLRSHTPLGRGGYFSATEISFFVPTLQYQHSRIRKI